MNNIPLPEKIREHLFVLAWIGLAVIAKYSIFLSTPSSSSAPQNGTGLANDATDINRNSFIEHPSPDMSADGDQNL